MQNSEEPDTRPLDNLDDEGDTTPTPVGPQIIEHAPTAAEEGEPEARKPRRSWLRRAIIIIVVVVVIVGLGVLGGMQSGRVLKNENQAIGLSVESVIQYELAVRDMNSGQCETARQRLEFIITELDAEYPGVAELLAQASLCIISTGTPTPLPTATPSPTPDVRSPDELWAEAQSLLAAEEWDLLIETLDSLRKADPNYQAVKVDSMYYIALRNRGEGRILVEGELEGGIFDLNRAEQFGPLDVQANSYRLWADLYVSGLSFWEVDWGQVIFYFEQVVPLVPNMWDGSMFAVDRLATASVFYSGELITLGDFYLAVRGWCDANDAYIKANSYYPLPPDVVPTAEWAAYRCELDPDATPRAPAP